MFVKCILTVLFHSSNLLHISNDFGIEMLVKYHVYINQSILLVLYAIYVI